MAELITVKQLAAISQNPDPAGFDLAGDVKALTPEMQKAGVTTRPRIAAFLANVCVETDRLKTLEEYGDEAYFRSFLGDQWRYHGRGYLMNTWRDAYANLSKVLGVDLVKSPDKLANDKTLAARAAMWFWTENNINKYADAGDFEAVCSIINRGQVAPSGPINGWDDRVLAHERALSVLPNDLDLGANGAEQEEVSMSQFRRVVIPQTFDHHPTAVRVRNEILHRVELPAAADVAIRDAGGGERVVIPHKFQNVDVATRVRDEIRRDVDLPPDKTVVLHTPRPKDGVSPGKPDRPQTEQQKMLAEVFRWTDAMLGAPYGDGWREGTWPALSSLYSRITEHDAPAWYDDRECVCGGWINILRFEVAGLPSVGWEQGDGWPGGTAAIGRHLAFAPGSRPYPTVENTPPGWLVWSPYLGALLRLQGHTGVATGDGRVSEARVPILSKNRTEDEGSRALVAGGGKPYTRIIPPFGPHGWLVK